MTSASGQPGATGSARPRRLRAAAALVGTDLLVSSVATCQGHVYDGGGDDAVSLDRADPDPSSC